MKTTLVAIALAAALVLPAGAAANPNQAEKRAAKQECGAERGKSEATREAFSAKYRSFSRCVKRHAADEDAENDAAHRNAAKECKAERKDPDFAATHDGKTFEEFYGTNANGRNAYGKCVSQKARAKKAEMDEEDAEEAREFRNAAKECAAERKEAGADAFAERYGTNRNKRNAFGKCVSSKTNESAA
jgi:hypothetical protein